MIKDNSTNSSEEGADEECNNKMRMKNATNMKHMMMKNPAKTKKGEGNLIVASGLIFVISHTICFKFSVYSVPDHLTSDLSFLHRYSI